LVFASEDDMSTGKFEILRRSYERPQLVKRDQLARVSGDDGVLISLLVKPGG
jgi:hypothetical protein